MKATPLVILLLSACLGWARELPAPDASALEAAIRQAQPGDTIVMADGVWRDAEIVFRAKGTAGAPITLRAQTPGKVVLSGESSLRFVGEHLVVEGLLFKDGAMPKGHVVAFRGDSDEEASDCRLTNSAIIDYNPPGDNPEPSTWVSLYGARNRVDACRFEGKNNASPLLIVWLNGQPNEHFIDHNVFARRTFKGENGGETIRVGDSKTSMQNSRTVVAQNVFEDCDGEVEIISNKSCENIYRHNAFRRSAGTLTLRHGNRCTVDGNWFFGEGKASTGGIRVIGEDHRIVNNYLEDLTGERFFSAIGFMAAVENSELNGYFQVKRAFVAFNTVVNCRNSFYFGIGFGSRGRKLPVEDSTFVGNLVFSQSAPLVSQLVEPVRSVWKGNVFGGADLGIPAVEGLLVRDPQLVRNSPGYWTPAEKSDFPMVASSGVTTDILGRDRGQESLPGCFVSGLANPIQFAPPAVKNTGPSW
jgi:poly(beta-D-mannuronate) lyase